MDYLDMLYAAATGHYRPLCHMIHYKTQHLFIRDEETSIWKHTENRKCYYIHLILGSDFTSHTL